jgi:hypothetical protein
MINSDWNRLAPISFMYDDPVTTTASAPAISTKVKSFYFNTNRIGKESWENYTNIYTDRLYLAGIVATIKMHASMSQVYPYLFKFKGEYSYTDMITGVYGMKYGTITSS